MSGRVAIRSLGRWALCACLLGGIAPSGGCDGAEGERAELSVYAAASLTDAFRDLAAGFEAAHPDVKVVINFAGSQVLRLQIEQGARADVFASANPIHMDALVQAGLVPESRVFAHNELVVIVPPDNPARIGAFADLPRARRLVIGTAQVPVGSYTRAMLRKAGARLGGAFPTRVFARVVSEENNVRLVRAKVELGEADAAIVYRTDAAACGGVRVVPIPDDLNVRAEYHIGVLADSARARLAARWLAFIASPAGQRILARHGFVTAP